MATSELDRDQLDLESERSGTVDVSGVVRLAHGDAIDGPETFHCRIDVRNREGQVAAAQVGIEWRGLVAIRRGPLQSSIRSVPEPKEGKPAFCIGVDAEPAGLPVAARRQGAGPVRD